MGEPPAPPTPFGPGDASVLDPDQVRLRSEKTREALRAARVELTRLRYGPGPDGADPAPREITRADGQWPFLLIRSYPGDVGRRPVPDADVPADFAGAKNSPDIIVTPTGPAGEPGIVDRPGLEALKARELTTLAPGTAYDIWVHVWNLGQNQVTGIRVRVRLDRIVFKAIHAGGYLGGAALDLGDRLSGQAHRAVKAATFIPPFLGIRYRMLLIATADCLSDPASGDLSPGADRHTAHHQLEAIAPPGPVPPRR